MHESQQGESGGLTAAPELRSPRAYMVASGLSSIYERRERARANGSAQRAPGPWVVGRVVAVRMRGTQDSMAPH
jgi:hypothetical protein